MRVWIVAVNASFDRVAPMMGPDRFGRLTGSRPAGDRQVSAWTNLPTGPAHPDAPPGRGFQTPLLALPKGGGAIRGMGETFSVSAVTGTASLAIPVATSPARSGFGPTLSLTYDSAEGNGIFGLGWSLALPAITRQTERGIPRYRDAEDSDVFLLGAEELVPAIDPLGNRMSDEASVPDFIIDRYRPRIEHDFSRIERWTRRSDGDTHWRILSSGNVMSVLGADVDHRIADPTDERRVSSWLLTEQRDDLGNAILFDYKREDESGVDVFQPHEIGRGGAGSPARSANRYPKRIRYGNIQPLLDEDDRRPVELAPGASEATEWMFEVVFDYGEHDPARPAPDDDGDWLVRLDPFSSYRSGFEIRTYRLVQRVLMFHHFPDEPGVGADCLVWSTDFSYRADATRGEARGAKLASVSSQGYVRTADGFDRTSTPPVEFEYSEAAVSDQVHVLSDEDAAGLPTGVGVPSRVWVDLDGEGLPGVLTDDGHGWSYKPNLGQGRLGESRLVDSRPSIAGLPTSRQTLLDLAGDGLIDLVQLDRQPAGFAERSAGAGWSQFTAFRDRPQLDWARHDLRLVDLTGDGFADVLTTDGDVLVWCPSLGEGGFGPPQRVALTADARDGPLPVFSDAGNTTFLADMSGDGMYDIVRVRNDEIVYWPNLGYGSFGSPVRMAHPPILDRPDRFDARRLRFADVDGSGTTDLLYLGNDLARLWFNEAGNGWTAGIDLPPLPHLTEQASIQVTDLLGNGTACLVWSSALPGDARTAVRYIDLVGGTKPHLLTGIRNNLGAETRVSFSSSTRAYLDDRRDGAPWITRLPFPVHVVAQVEDVDHVTGVRHVGKYRYHDGYFDGASREFRGFGMVEHDDTESFEDYVAGVVDPDGPQDATPQLYQPAVRTRTWYHTGAYLEGDRFLHHRRDAYYGGQRLADAVLPADLPVDGFRDAVRALKGLPLRTEVWGLDDSAAAAHPYTVSENSYEVRGLQPAAGGRSGVFLPIGLERVDFLYDRRPEDPRVTHELSLKVGAFGQVLQSASVVYGRQSPDPGLPETVTRAQRASYVTFGETDFTPAIDTSAPVPTFRVPVPWDGRAFELSGAEPAGDLWTAAELKAAIAGSNVIGYEAEASPAVVERRLLSRTRTRFRSPALAPLPFGEQSPIGLRLETYRLTFSASTIAGGFAGEVTADDMAAAGYVHLDGDEDLWWVPSGVDVYGPDPGRHFFLPVGVRDGLGVETSVTLDDYDLLPVRSTIVQAPWNVTLATNDYRILGPVAVVDPNGNGTAVEVDGLGMTTKSVVMGKAGSTDGDTLADPTSRMEYDLFAWQNHGRPCSARVFAREQHGPAAPTWHSAISYSDGHGQVVMTKTKAPPGPALVRQPDGTFATAPADPRWVATGRTVVNNKGNLVKQYEPFFSPTDAYDEEEAAASIGVTPILTYDPLGRNIRTDYPNGTFTATAMTPWMQRLFDVNDTVRDSRWYADRGSPDPASEPEPTVDLERRAAWLAAVHAGTPSVVHVDSLGRPILAVSDYGGGRQSSIRVESDLTGRVSALFDELDREVASGFTGMAGHAIWSESAERGRRWTLFDIHGNLVRAWDEHGRRFTVDYDAIRRAIAVSVAEGAGPARTLMYVVHGDRVPNAASRNLLGCTYQVFDGAGSQRVVTVDFEGNVTSVERTLTRDPTTTPDWSVLLDQPDLAGIDAAAAAILDPAEVFTAASTVDALGRPVSMTLPGGTVVRPAYDEAGRVRAISAQIDGAGAPVEYLRSQESDARGLRLSAEYGNGRLARFSYDPDTLRLDRMTTVMAGAQPGPAIQDLRYVYDPMGNVTFVGDEAQQTIFFDNAVARAERRYVYDALYQLVAATGREHATAANSAIHDRTDGQVESHLPHPNDTAAIRPYTETYAYDLAGNITEVRHAAAGGAGSWTQRFRYAYEVTPADRTNRLARSSRPGDPDAGPFSQTYDHDVYGNMTRLNSPTPGELVWNAFDQLASADLGGGGVAHYAYGSTGGRVRKVILRQGALRTERIYLGALEIYRERLGTNQPRLVRRTLHIGDGSGRIAQVDIKDRDEAGSDPANPVGVPVVRYQHGDHLGSAVVETDAAGQVISYEEFHPYGASSYRSAKSGTNLSLKRYRFAGKERDDESGLIYFGARYYAPWLARWISADPAGYASGLNLFAYCRNSPVARIDPDGTQDQPRCIWILASGGLVGQDTVPGGCWQDVKEGKVLPENIAPGMAPRAPAAPAPRPGPPRPRPRPRGRPGSHRGTSSGADAPAAPTAPAPTPPPPAQEDGGGGPTVTPQGGASGAGTQAVTRNPTGPTLEVPENFDDAKIRAYRERITTDRGVGIRSAPSGSRSRTADLRRANKGLRDAFERSLPGGRRPAGTDIDHTVELQHIIRGNATAGADTVRPQDHRVQNSSLNNSQGASAQQTGRRALAAGAVEDVPAGGVARTSQIGRFYNQPGFRTAARALGYGLMTVGPIVTGYAALQTDNTAVKAGGVGLAAVEAGGVGTYFYGRFAMGGATGQAAGRLAMTMGGRVALGAGGAAQALLAGYAAYQDWQRDDMTAFAFDAAAAVGGVLLVAAAIVTSPVWAVGLAVAGIATGIAAGVFHLGRALDWW